MSQIPESTFCNIYSIQLALSQNHNVNSFLYCKVGVRAFRKFWFLDLNIEEETWFHLLLNWDQGSGLHVYVDGISYANVSSFSTSLTMNVTENEEKVGTNYIFFISLCNM